MGGGIDSSDTNSLEVFIGERQLVVRVAVIKWKPKLGEQYEEDIL